MLIIDTHAHVFSEDEQAYPPRESPSRPPPGTGTLERLTEEVERHEVRAVTAVQVSGFYGFDNRYVRAVALQNPHWLAGVCTLDPLDESAPRKLREFARDGSMRGVFAASLRRTGGSTTRACGPSGGTASEEGVPVNVLAGYEVENQLHRLLDAFSRASGGSGPLPAAAGR